MSTQAAQLDAGLAGMGLALPPVMREKLLAYLALLYKWNRTYSLTALRDEHKAVSHHLLDSLAILPFVPSSGSLLDVGSGGGMPGVTLAIIFPKRKFTLLDSNGKKTRFLTQVKLELKLDNLEVIHNRVEAFTPERAFSGIISRAFSSLADFTNWTRHLGDVNSHWLAMKGVHPDDELQALPEDFRLNSCQILKVPGCQGQRHLLILQRQP